MTTYSFTDPNKPEISKSPSAVLDYIFNWTQWLDKVVDTIASYTVTVSGGLTQDSASLDGTNKKVTAILSGGSLGKTYSVACAITTANGRTETRTIYVRIVTR